MHTGSRRLLASSAVVLLAAALLAAAGAVATSIPAWGAPLKCGTVVTQDTVLAADLVCDDTSDGIVVDANNVVLDLRGHTISGPGASVTGYAAVRVTDRTGVTIRNGTVTGFQAGVVIDGGSGNTATKLVASNNDQGISLATGSGHMVSKSTVVDNGRDGVRVGLVANALVTQNSVAGNVWGITVADWSSDAVVSRNMVTASRNEGIVVFGGSTGTTISQNDVSGSGSFGISTQADTSSSFVSQNRSSANAADGLRIKAAAGPATVVEKNTAVGNGGRGIVAIGNTTDRGGNKAAANQTDPQCLGVDCSAP